jgi:uncharacterized protein YuzE
MCKSDHEREIIERDAKSELATANAKLRELIEYDNELEMAYIKISKKKVVSTCEQIVNVDLDNDGEIVGVELFLGRNYQNPMAKLAKVSKLQKYRPEIVENCSDDCCPDCGLKMIEDSLDGFWVRSDEIIRSLADELEGK